MKTQSFLSYFSEINDPRSHVNKLHDLNNILLIGVISTICGASTWKQMEDFAITKIEFLKTVVDLPNGVPSDDTFNRVFSSIDTKEFEKSFVNWVSSLTQSFNNEVISIDGKTVRGAKTREKNSPVHIVSAWANQNNMVIGQVKVADKSNEITAIPELLDLLFIEGDIITIDAMGTQTEIVKKIIKKGGDYVLAVKENQKELLSEIKDEFMFGKDLKTFEHIDGGHGRIETRICSVVNDFKFITNENEKWVKLKQVVKIESIREFKNSDKSIEKATRYFITSLDESPEKILSYVRSHWGIENKLHWILDVQFDEDQSRKRNENAAQNYSIVLKIALNLLKNEKTVKQGIQGKRLKAGWDNSYLLKLLNIKV
jgi:predicted transposase YbfD/YdcC